MEDTNNIEDVQAYISCVSLPSTIDELMDLAERDELFPVEIVLNAEDYEYLEWTAPRWARKGDIVLFYFSKTANVKLSNLRRELREDTFYNSSQKKILKEWIDKANTLFKEYGGKIMAVGILLSDPYYIGDSEFDNPNITHYNLNIWADIGYVNVFEDMLHINECEFVEIARQKQCTPLFGEIYERLRDEIWYRNEIPGYFADTTSNGIPVYKINNSNWLKINNEYKRKYKFESQFRSLYVDYFLSRLSDNKVVYRECPCLKKKSVHPSYVDNVIKIHGLYLPVEVKLNIDAERDIIKQVKKYCELTKLYLNTATEELADNNSIASNNVLIIDVNNIYWFDYKRNTLEMLISLEEIKDEKDINIVKDRIKNLIFSK